MLKMKKSELKEYKALLLALRARLRGDVTAMADTALKRNREQAAGDVSSMPIHMADLGSDNFEQEFTLSLMETEEDTLAAIEAALVRVEDGAYGACEECEGPIARSRLQAIPYTPLCIKCAQRREND
ncbi:MAG: TraR/DksA family transcriptional regulator [Pirellulales bacterium]